MPPTSFNLLLQGDADEVPIKTDSSDSEVDKKPILLDKKPDPKAQHLEYLTASIANVINEHDWKNPILQYFAADLIVEMYVRDKPMVFKGRKKYLDFCESNIASGSGWEAYIKTTSCMIDEGGDTATVWSTFDVNEKSKDYGTFQLNYLMRSFWRREAQGWRVWKQTIVRGGGKCPELF